MNLLSKLALETARLALILSELAGTPRTPFRSVDRIGLMDLSNKAGDRVRSIRQNPAAVHTDTVISNLIDRAETITATLDYILKNPTNTVDKIKLLRAVNTILRQLKPLFP
jgi:hypothetical protein